MHSDWRQLSCVCLTTSSVCPSSAESTSKSPYREAVTIPWDNHLHDDLLKSLIKRARAFEDEIRYELEPTLHSYPQLRNAFVCMQCSIFMSLLKVANCLVAYSLHAGLLMAAWLHWTEELSNHQVLHS